MTGPTKAAIRVADAIEYIRKDRQKFSLPEPTNREIAEVVDAVSGLRRLIAALHFACDALNWDRNHKKAFEMCSDALGVAMEGQS